MKELPPVGKVRERRELAKQAEQVVQLHEMAGALTDLVAVSVPGAVFEGQREEIAERASRMRHEAGSHRHWDELPDLAESFKTDPEGHKARAMEQRASIKRRWAATQKRHAQELDELAEWQRAAEQHDGGVKSIWLQREEDRIRSNILRDHELYDDELAGQAQVEAWMLEHGIHLPYDPDLGLGGYDPAEGEPGEGKAGEGDPGTDQASAGEPSNPKSKPRPKPGSDPRADARSGARDEPAGTGAGDQHPWLRPSWAPDGTLSGWVGAEVRTPVPATASPAPGEDPGGSKQAASPGQADGGQDGRAAPGTNPWGTPVDDDDGDGGDAGGSGGSVVPAGQASRPARPEAVRWTSPR